jgi:hypothetical protein
LIADAAKQLAWDHAREHCLKENSDLLLEAVRTCSVEPLERNQLFAAIIKATKTEIDENSSHWDE